MTVRIRTLIAGIVAVLLLGGAYWFYTNTSSPIRHYEPSRDRAFIIDMFKKNWYWLIHDYSPDYDVEFMLDKKAPIQNDMSQAGKLLIYTYVVEGKPAGFLAIYEEELKVGRILFLGVGDEYRGKGYARQLMKFAIKALKDRGMITIRMNTRSDNTRARKLYENLGFKEIWTDGAYIIYEIIP